MTNTIQSLRSILGLIILQLVGLGHVAWSKEPLPAPPSAIYGELFARVQTDRIFPDSKTFADATPRFEPSEITRKYEAQKGTAGFSLTTFVHENFVIPEGAGSDFRTTPEEDVRKHIDRLWDILTREPRSVPQPDSLVDLTTKYVVPGGRFRELYYWDSYFTMVGLQTSHRDDLVSSMLDNFAGLIDRYGHIPNGSRTYQLSRSQAPFFAAMVELEAERQGVQALVRRLLQLEREYAFWMEGAEQVAIGAAHRRVVRLSDGSILNRYWDDSSTPRDEAYVEDMETAKKSSRPASQVYRDLRAAAESGWDFSSRWFADGKTLSTIHTTDFVPVDLNSLLYKLELVIARGCKVAHRLDCERDMRKAANTRKSAIVRVMWHKKLGAFVDFDFKANEQSSRLTIATAYPVFVGIARRSQVRSVARAVREHLLVPHGVATTTEATGEQWDAPNGWAPHQWIAIDALRRHGEPKLAEEIAERWVAENARVYCATGKLVEKYDVRGAGAGTGGEYPVQDGFGWTNAVLRKLLDIYPRLGERQYRFTGGACEAEIVQPAR